MFVRTSRMLALGAGILVVGACADAESPVSSEAAVVTAEAHQGPGTAATAYKGELKPLNGDLSYRPVDGVVRVQVVKGRLTVLVNATGLEPGIPHPQHIHGWLSGAPGSCPGPDADANGDGVIDVVEGVPDYGPILLTLDGDPTDGGGTQVESLPTTTDAAGSIHYRVTADLAEVEAGVGGPLDLGSRHVVLHGVNPETPLPTAASLGGLPAWLTLPVACAELSPAGS